MAKSRYLPRTDSDRVVWLNNFANKFAVIAAQLNLTADVESVNNDAAVFEYIVNRVESYNSTKQRLVGFKKLLRDGPALKELSMLSIPAEPTPPAKLVGGIFPRIARLVQLIKHSTNYTEFLGKELGIIGSEMMIDEKRMKPNLKLSIKGGRNVEIQWTKGNADALHIETDKGNGWRFMAVDTVPPYTDPTPITTPATWTYRAIYLVDDERVGLWSDMVSIAVSGV